MQKRWVERKGVTRGVTIRCKKDDVDGVGEQLAPQSRWGKGAEMGREEQ